LLLALEFLEPVHGNLGLVADADQLHKRFALAKALGVFACLDAVLVLVFDLVEPLQVAWARPRSFRCRCRDSPSLTGSRSPCRRVRCACARLSVAAMATEKRCRRRCRAWVGEAQESSQTARGKDNKTQESIGPGNSEANADVPIGRVEPVPAGGTRVPWVVVPGTAPQKPAGTIPLLPCTAVQGRSGVGVVVAVLHPLPHVTVHIVQSKGIGKLLPHRAGLTRRISTKPSMLPQLTRIASEGIVSGGTCACGVLALGFGRQPIPLACSRTQALDKGLGIVPGDVLHRQGVAFEPTWVAAHDRLPFALRDFELADRKVWNGNSADRALGITPSVMLGKIGRSWLGAMRCT